MPRVSDGRQQHPLYRTWTTMRQRCREHPRYAGRGISVCERWNDFWAFVSDVGAKPDDGQRWTLDRIDNDGNYEPGNVRWATYQQQNLNRRPIVVTPPAKCRQGHDYAAVKDSSGYTRCGHCLKDHNNERSRVDAEKRKHERRSGRA